MSYLFGNQQDDKRPIHHHTISDLEHRHSATSVNTHHKGVQQYYWVVAEEGERRVVYGPRSQYQDAERLCQQLLSKGHVYSANIVQLPTANRDAARDMVRGRTLQDTGSITESFQRMGWKE